MNNKDQLDLSIEFKNAYSKLYDRLINIGNGFTCTNEDCGKCLNLKHCISYYKVHKSLTDLMKKARLKIL